MIYAVHLVASLNVKLRHVSAGLACCCDIPCTYYRLLVGMQSRGCRGLVVRVHQFGLALGRYVTNYGKLA